MPQYLVAIQHPDTFVPGSVTPETMQDIKNLNLEMVAAGVRFFAGGLEPVAKAKSIKEVGNPTITDGPFLEAKEHIGGFWILDCASMDEALEWGRKATVACRTPVEVRGFLQMPASVQATPDKPFEAQK